MASPPSPPFPPPPLAHLLEATFLLLADHLSVRETFALLVALGKGGKCVASSKEVQASLSDRLGYARRRTVSQLTRGMRRRCPECGRRTASALRICPPCSAVPTSLRSVLKRREVRLLLGKRANAFFRETQRAGRTAQGAFLYWRWQVAAFQAG